MKLRFPFGLLLCLYAVSLQKVLAQDAKPALTFQSAREGHVFPENSGEVVLQIPAGAGATGGEVLLQNETGAPIGRFAVPDGATAVRIPLQNKGHYVLQARVTTGTGGLTAQTSAAVLGPVAPDAERLASALGMAKIEGSPTLLAASSSGWDRGFTPQHAIVRNEKGEIDWSPSSRRDAPKEIYNRVEAVMSPPAWVVAPENRAKQAITVTYPPADWDSYRKVARVFAATRPWVKYFEGLNEPDANHWKGTDEDLVKYYRVMREEVHAAGHGQKVLGPCFWSIDLTHLDKLVKLGLLNAVDGISMHSYANAPPEGKWIEDIRALKAYLVSQGRPEMPVFLTEYGWNSGAGDTPSPEQELVQARYAARGISLLAAENLAGSQYFVLRYAANPRDNGWSITRGDNTPRPAYTAVSNIFRWLGNARGQGLLHPTPSSYLLLFSKHNRTVAVGWDTQGTSRLALPLQPLRAETMTGAPLPVTASTVELSTSPVFLEFDTPALATPAPALPAVTLTRGKTLTLKEAPGQIALPLPLRVQGKELSAPADTTPGLYTGLQFAGGQWRQYAVQVNAPWNIENVRVVWPVGSSSPEVQFTARNDAGRVTLLPYLKLDNLPDEFGAQVTLNSGQSRTISIPIKNYFYGTRLQGRAMLEQHVSSGVSSLSLPFDVLPIVAAPRGATAKSPRLTSANWQAFGPGQPKSLPPADCSVTLETTYDKQALHLRVAVRDDVEHFSSGTSPFWAGDSVQFAFDLKRLGTLVSAGSTPSPRRVLEYGAGKRDGQPTVWRTMSTLPDLPQDVVESQARTTVQRQSDETRYEIELPWRLLGLTQAPPAGATLGFNLAINDSDGSIIDRAGLEITPGIVSTKDTAAFATLLFQ